MITLFNRRATVAFALTALLAGCGTDSGSGGGSQAQDTSETATDGTSGGGADAVSGADTGTSGGADAAAQADAGTTPDTTPDTGTTPMTPADIVKIANAAVAVWSDDGTERVAFMPESQTMKELDGADCPDGATDCGDKYDPKAAAKDIQEWFSDHLFNKELADLKLSTDTSAVFCLKADEVCDSEPDAQGNPVVDAKCAAGLAKVPLCLAVYVFDGDLLKGELRVGISPQVVPATFVLSKTELSAEADLAKVLEAAKMVTTAMDEELPEAFPQVAKGKLSLAFTRDAAGEALTGVLAVLESVHVAAFAKTDKRFYELKLAKAAEVLKLLFGKDKQSMGVQVGFAAIDLGLAMDLMLGEGEQDCGGTTPGGSGGATPGSGGSGGSGDPCGTPAKPKTGAFFAAIPGLTVDLTFAASKTQDTFTAKGLGLGSKTTTVTFEDAGKVHPLGSLDLNAAATPPRVVNVTVSYAGGQVKLETTPQLHAVVAHALAVIAPQFGDDIPTFLHAGQSSVQLDGASAPAMEMGEQGNTTTPTPTPGKGAPGGSGSDPGANDGGDDFPHMKVLAGLLTLKASGLSGGAADVLLSVKQGLCLAQAEGEGGDNQHFFAQLAQAACK